MFCFWTWLFLNHRAYILVVPSTVNFLSFISLHCVTYRSDGCVQFRLVLSISQVSVMQKHDIQFFNTSCDLGAYMLFCPWKENKHAQKPIPIFISFPSFQMFACFAHSLKFLLVQKHAQKWTWKFSEKSWFA